jgi:secondary thiamine-phosphate synthase enzyme
MIRHYTLSVGPYPRGFHLITEQVFDVVKHWPKEGMLQVFIQHTSAGICINENADATVRMDFELYFNRIVPENIPGLQHDIEGPDDMPAHIKSVIAGSTIQIPIVNGNPALGTWQGIFLCEFRNHARKRDLIISIME